MPTQHVGRGTTNCVFAAVVADMAPPFIGDSFARVLKNFPHRICVRHLPSSSSTPPPTPKKWRKSSAAAAASARGQRHGKTEAASKELSCGCRDQKEKEKKTNFSRHQFPKMAAWTNKTCENELYIRGSAWDRKCSLVAALKQLRTGSRAPPCVLL